MHLNLFLLTITLSSNKFWLIKTPTRSLMGIDLRWITDQVRLESSTIFFFLGGGGESKGLFSSPKVNKLKVTVSHHLYSR